MTDGRDDLLAILEGFYRKGSVWGEPSREDGVVRVPDSGGVIWYGLAVLPDDLSDPNFPGRISELADRHMPEPDGRRCVLELLPAEACREDVEALLRELRLEERVGVYSLAA